jgi:hypothetical protein
MLPFLEKNCNFLRMTVHDWALEHMARQLTCGKDIISARSSPGQLPACFREHYKSVTHFAIVLVHFMFELILSFDRNCPAGAHHKCRKRTLKVAAEGLANRYEVLRGLRLQQRSYAMNMGSSPPQFESNEYVLHPFIRPDDPLPQFLAVFVIADSQSVDGVSHSGSDTLPCASAQVPGRDSCLDKFNLVTQGFYHDRGCIHTGDLVIDYIILSFAAQSRPQVDADCQCDDHGASAEESEDAFVHDLTIMVKNAAIAVAGHTLWMQISASCNTSRPAPTHAEMSRLLSHLQGEYLMDVAQIDPELKSMILNLPLNWQQVIYVHLNRLTAA